MEAIIIALIIGAVMSAFNKNKEKENENKKRRTPPPRRNEEQGEIDWKSIFQQEKDSTDQDPGPKNQRPTRPVPEAEADVYREEPGQTTYSDAHDQYKKKAEELQQIQAEAKKKMDHMEGYSLDQDAIGTNGTSSSRRQGNRHTVTKNDAVNGIIWSEILGPPRSRRSLTHSRNLPIHRKRS